MILLMVLCLMSRKKNNSYWPEFACILLLKSCRLKSALNWKHLFVLCPIFPSFIFMQLWFMRGYRCPRLNTSYVCVRQRSLLSFAQLKRIKVCFFFSSPPNIITGYEMSHSGVLETQQWERKNLFIRLWLPEHCPMETERETNTHTHMQNKKKKKSTSLFFHSFIWILMYSLLCQSLF